MTGPDEILLAVEAIYAAGLDAELWPKALAAIANCVGGSAASLELFHKQSLQPNAIITYGLPPVAEFKYLDHYAALNRRLPVVARDRLGDMCWDWRIFDEQTIDRDPFYMEFLADQNLRYFVGGIIVTNREEFAGICVHFSPKQGHVDKPGVAMLERFLPHVRGAFDVARRLKSVGETQRSLKRALDWLADGVVLVAANGRLLYANEAMHAISRADDGIRVKAGQIELTGEARSRFDKALDAVLRFDEGDIRNASSDFPVARPSGLPGYLFSVRPLSRTSRERRTATTAAAIVFVRDPTRRNAAAIRVLREVFGLTDAEASLAQALQSGIPLREYAAARIVSLNTVYTHLRRLKDKTGSSRMADLIHKLGDLQVPLRVG